MVTDALAIPDTANPDAVSEPAKPLGKTPLHAMHVAHGARMVPFAGYDMPVQFPTGILAEHTHTRSAAGLFDVSHMGQAFLIGPDRESSARAMEALVPADVLDLAPGRQVYSQLLNESGGILDDLMITRSIDQAEDGALMLVVNASRRDADFAHITERLPENVRLLRADHRALLALQGPQAAEVMTHHCAEIADLEFMTARSTRVGGIDCHVSRSGYTGEDGFEISVRAEKAKALSELILADDRVKPIGLGARDSLRLEAGLCLYGHDIDETTSPIEAGLAWSIKKRRREEGGFPGASRIQDELANGPARRRVGLSLEGRAPAREGCEIRSVSGEAIGTLTSGGYGPSVGAPIAMGYVNTRFAEIGTPVLLIVRGKELVAKVVKMPFAPHRYHRK